MFSPVSHLCLSEFTPSIVPALFSSHAVCFYIHQQKGQANVFPFLPPNTDIFLADFSVDKVSDVTIVDKSRLCFSVWGMRVLVFCCVVGVVKEKGKVQQNSIVMLVVNDLYNKWIPFFRPERDQQFIQSQWSKLIFWVNFLSTFTLQVNMNSGCQKTIPVQPGLKCMRVQTSTVLLHGAK